MKYVLLLLLAGCATVQVGAYKMDKEAWDRDRTEVQQRAAFELKCPAEQIQLTILAVNFPGEVGPQTAKQIGVDGCGHRLIYVVSQGGWILNSSDTENKEAQK